MHFKWYSYSYAQNVPVAIALLNKKTEAQALT